MMSQFVHRYERFYASATFVDTQSNAKLLGKASADFSAPSSNIALLWASCLRRILGYFLLRPLRQCHHVSFSNVV